MFVDADILQPEAFGFVVFFEHRHPELLRRDSQILGQKFPGEVDGVFFEIIAKAEVAQHLKKSVVTCGIAYVFQVVMLAPGANAALAGRSADVIAVFAAKKHVFKLHHAGVGEQQSRVVAWH